MFGSLVHDFPETCPQATFATSKDWELGSYYSVPRKRFQISFTSEGLPTQTDWKRPCLNCKR